MAMTSARKVLRRAEISSRFVVAEMRRKVPVRAEYGTLEFLKCQLYARRERSGDVRLSILPVNFRRARLGLCSEDLGTST